MRLLLAMVGKDLRRRARAPLATLLLLAFPLIFAGLLALTFGGSGNQVPKVRLLIEDRDGGLVGQLVSAAFQQGEAQKHFEVKKVGNVADASGNPAALLEREDATALLRLPAGFSDDVFAGRPAKIELVKSPAQSILPDVAEQVTSVLAEGLSAASRLLRGPLDAIRTSSTREGGASDPRVAEIAVLVNQAVTRARPYVLPPVITLETAARPEPPKQGAPKPPAGGSPSASIFLLILPGISVYALFSLADQSMRDLLVEARLKTLRRQLAGPVTVGQVLAGKTLATAAVAALSLLTLTVAGVFVAPRGVSLAGYLLLSLSLVVATTGFSSFIFGLARGERQGATLANLASLVMAFAGGAFLPLDSLPAALRAVSPFSLIYWASSGYQKLIVESSGLQALLPNIAVLGGVGLLLLAVSAPLWRRRLLRGDVA
ncbi:MAG TPA: ABC transporter permease [Thermoanaerobaculia bacterium]|nr:ABC transporter permease [Thermoanaerobaculia bacterium]